MVGHRPVGSVLLARELAEVEKGDDVELGQEPRLELVDVAEQHLVDATHLGPLHHQPHVALVLAGRP